MRLEWHLQIEVSEQVKAKSDKGFLLEDKKVLRVCSALGKYESNNFLQIKQMSTKVNSNKWQVIKVH